MAQAILASKSRITVGNLCHSLRRRTRRNGVFLYLAGAEIQNTDGWKIFGRTEIFQLAGRTEKLRTDGRKIFGRTDGNNSDGRTEKFSDGRKIFGRTEKFRTDGKIKTKKTEKFILPLLGEFFRTSRDSSVSGQDPHKSRDVRKNSPKSGKTKNRKNN